MNYKETLNLPKTEFPMKANLTTREPEILSRWENENLYEQIQKARENDPAFRSARWTAFRKWRRPYGHGAQ